MAEQEDGTGEFDPTVVEFEYKNWKGEVRRRRVKPIRVWFGSTMYHPMPQRFLKAIDLEKNEERDFAVDDIRGWVPAPNLFEER